MKKTPLFVALCATSLCGAVQAQSSVNVYGKLYPYLVQESGRDHTAPGTAVSNLSGSLSTINGVPRVSGMQSGNSRIGFRGIEDLGGGLKAIFQLETQVAVDSGVGGAGGTGAFWNRDTFVGMNGGFGEVRLGNMDTIFKTYGDTIGFLGVSSGTPMSSSNILRKPGFGTSNNARFHERRANSVAYESPEIAGVQIGAQVASSEGVSTTANPGIGSAKTYSLGVKYDAGPLYLALAHEIHINFFGGSSQAPSALRNTGATDNVKARDTATQATVEWRINKQNKVEFDWIRKNYKENAVAVGRFRNYVNDAYLVSFESRLSDQWRIAGHYVRSKAGSCERVTTACSTDGLEGQKFLIGGGYYFSRRTSVFAAYNQVVNGKSARFSAASEFGAPTPGEDFRQFIVGVSHSF